METILRITDISASPIPTRSNRGARAQQAVVSQWLREQATPSGPHTVEASVIEAVVPTEPVLARPAAPSARVESRCGEQLTRRSARIRSRSRSSRVPA